MFERKLQVLSGESFFVHSSLANQEMTSIGGKTRDGPRLNSFLHFFAWEKCCTAELELPVDLLRLLRNLEVTRREASFTLQTIYLITQVVFRLRRL